MLFLNSCKHQILNRNWKGGGKKKFNHRTTKQERLT